MSVYTLEDLAGGLLRRDPAGARHAELIPAQHTAPSEPNIVAAARLVGQGAALFNRPSEIPQALQYSTGVHTHNLNTMARHAAREPFPFVRR